MNKVSKWVLSLSGSTLTGLAINGVLPNSELWLDYIVGIKSVLIILLIFLLLLTLFLKERDEPIPINWFSVSISVSLIINAIVFGYVGYAVVSITGLIVIITHNKTVIKER